MTLEQLRIFVAVAEREHVTQAAGVLNLTQSATSAAIGALESRHAVKLFDRIGRRIALTDAGRLFLAEARAVLARAASAEAVLADLAGLRRGRLAFAASQTVANYWLPPLLHRFRARYPGVETPVTIGNTQSVAQAVHDGFADLGIVEGEIDDPHLAIEPVADDQMVLVVGRGHPWATRRIVEAADFGESAWVLREPGSGTRRLFEDMLSRAGRTLDELVVVLELPSNEAVSTAVTAGAGATVISRLVVQPVLQAGDLVAVEAELPQRRFFVLQHKERYVSRVAAAFRDLMRERRTTAGPREQ
ncbi:LysR substrate-binding domain-containing protein [Bosea sp. LjRoot9]|uniref:LysR family transcriptional regulator n=1 Tax=Bosea sp. LjRoot9 TaxID=3342341 RepID=UPI003ED01F31